MNIQKPPPDFIYDPIRDKQHNLQKVVGRQKKPMSRWKKVLLVLTGLLTIGLIVLGLFAFKNIAKIAPNFFRFETKLQGENEGRVNILLLGIGDPGHDGEGLADTNILISVNTRDHKLAMVSIPRDTRVKVKGYGYQKINAAHSYGDIPLAIETVKNFLDVPIHYYVRANFTGLKQAVDAVGGIEINNQHLLYDPEYPCDKNQWKSCGFKLQPGRQKIDGTNALKYARCRKGSCGDDFGRATRQQEVISAIRSKALSTETILNPAKLTALIQTAGDNVKTDLSVQGMLRLNDLTKDIPNDQTINAVFSIEPNGFLKSDPQGSSDLLPTDPTLTAIQSFVDDIFRLGPIWQENATIVIQNGTSTVGLGGKLETKLSKEKMPLTITQVTNALKHDYTTTKIIDYTNGSKNHTKSYLEGTLKVTATTPEKSVKDSPQDFVIIIGADSSNYLPPTSANTNSL